MQHVATVHYCYLTVHNVNLSGMLVQEQLVAALSFYNKAVPDGSMGVPSNQLVTASAASAEDVVSLS
jgi:hypothetical protein